MLQDVRGDRLYAAELGCDPRGNPLKRMLLTACEQAIKDAPEVLEPQVVMATPRRSRAVRGTAWGAALALVMTFGLLGSIMVVELASRKVRQKKAIPSLNQEAGSTPTLPAVPAPAPEEFEPNEPDEPPKYY